MNFTNSFPERAFYKERREKKINRKAILAFDAEISETSAVCRPRPDRTIREIGWPMGLRDSAYEISFLRGHPHHRAGRSSTGGAIQTRPILAQVG